MSKAVDEGWDKFLNPRRLKENLIAASLFLAAYETLRSSMIDQIHSLYWRGFDQSGDILDPKYATEVLARNRSPLRASLLWLRDKGVLDDPDLAVIDSIREHRNEIAHALPKFVASSGAQIDRRWMDDIYRIVAKVDRWWIREVEIPSNPDFDDQDVTAIPDHEIKSGNMIFLQLIVSIATGDEAHAQEFYEAVRRRLQQAQHAGGSRARR